ncbi:MAG TPA: type VI secretion system-associated protein TagF [Polyangia bacterium]|jgi:type VI secretion system protein ImpM|nr:type VI secretion system-associated protein TagF [Polyangia bacterium]
MNWATLIGDGGRNGGAGDATIGLYGKVPGQPDFLRSNAGEFSQAGLDLWFQEGMEIIRAEGTSLPPSPTAFLLARSDSPHAFVGAFVPSTDAAGRPFPLAVFACIGSRGLTDAFPSLTDDYAPFIEAAGALLREGGGLTGPELVERTRSLTANLPADGGHAPASARLGGDPSQPLRAGLNGSASALGYALRTLASACDQAAKTGPDGRSGVITVQAPTPDASARALWLELARRRLRWREGVPSLLWTDGEAPRILLTLGQPSPAALSYLANPRHRAARFWPLQTDVAVARDQAMSALTPEQRRMVENPRVTLGDLVTAFSI